MIIFFPIFLQHRYLIMECWAHAAAIRRRLKNGSSLTGSSASSDITINTSSNRSSRKTSSATSVSSISNMSPTRPSDDMTRERTHSPNQVPHICVVGAGMAGLKTADVLASRGFDVTILEGRDRIGGRVSSFVLFSSLIMARYLMENRCIKVLTSVIW